ncbi:MAG: site-specific integrase [Actinomycetota bacterium]|nr:site-specific integrase [Actinomycetota bacterium]
MAARRLVKTRDPGIYQRHRAGCRRESGCDCSYQATVYSARDGKLIRKHFDSLAAARNWRHDASTAVRKGRLRASTSTTLQHAGEALIAGMRDGSMFDRSGRAYKPSTIRGYERGLRLHVLPQLGSVRLSALDRGMVQHLVERLHGDGYAASSIQNILNPLQVICRRAMHRGEIAIDPTDGLQLPAVRGRRDTIASPQQAERLIAALPEGERALWATAFYAGLRRGELRGLRWTDVDFDAKVIHVRRAWDDSDGEIEVKSDAGRRAVPMAGPLRQGLAAHRLRTGRTGEALVFGRTPTSPFVPSTTRARARKAWKAAGLEPLTPHEARHCAASYLIAAGLNAKELSTYLGHADIRVTYNVYGHLLPGGEREAADRLTAFLERSAELTG